MVLRIIGNLFSALPVHLQSIVFFVRRFYTKALVIDHVMSRELFLRHYKTCKFQNNTWKPIDKDM